MHYGIIPMAGQGLFKIIFKGRKEERSEVRQMDIEKDREREKKMNFGIIPMAGQRGESERKIFFYPNKNIYDYL